MSTADPRNLGSSQQDYSAVAPNWADNIPMESLDASPSPAATSTQQQTASTQRFWSAPPRPASSPTSDVIEVTFSAVRLINKISYDVATFPHSISIQYYDNQLQEWLPVISRTANAPEPLIETVLTSSPATLPPANAVQGQLHPQHSFSGHWHSLESNVRPITTRRLRFVLTHSTAGDAPRNGLGQLIDYSLGLRNVAIGYAINSREDIPATPRSSLTTNECAPFASTVDASGNAVNYSLRVNRADNILANTEKDSDGLDLLWRSEPQPFSWAVVNFYLDSRDGDGNPQTIDRLFIEPVTEGPNINLYYSNDEPQGAFVAGEDPLSASIGVVTGTGAVVLSKDTAGDINFVDIDNRPFGFNPGQTWWMGFDLNFNFDSKQNNTNHALFDCAAFSLSMLPLGMHISVHGADSLTLPTQNFDNNSIVRLVLYYDGTTMVLETLVNGERLSATLKLSVPLGDYTVPVLRYGGFLGSDPGSGSFDLASYTLKIHEVPDEDTIIDYFSNPRPYAVKAALPHLNDHKTDNALLRYDPAQASALYPSGFVGGPPDHFSQMRWSPIARDFVCRKGFLNFQATRAKYWKMEFCNLVPAPFEVYVPVTRTVRTYKPEMWSQTIAVRTSSLNISVQRSYTGMQSSVALSSSTLVYRDQKLVTMRPQTTETVYSNTQVRIVNDASSGTQLSKSSFMFSFTQMHGSVTVPRFPRYSVHEYQETQVESSTKTAFFVGLRRVQVFKVNYLALEDTPEYVEMFHDTTNLDPKSNWTLREGNQLTSGDALYAEVRSLPMPSNKAVRAIQFASTQVDPRQLLPDDDFDDPDHTVWSPVGDGTLAPRTEIVTAVGSVLRVDRSPQALNWGSLAASLKTWQGALDQNLTYLDVLRRGNPAEESGGVESALYNTPQGGRVHVAARVVTPRDLTQPLYVQLVDESDRVMAEAGTTVRSGQVAEWYCSYTIGEGGESFPYLWGDFEVPLKFSRFVDSFDHSNAAALPFLDSAQAWSQPTGSPSHSISSNDALQNASGTAVDQVQVDSIWGSLSFTLGTMGTGTLVPLVLFDPFTLNDQGALGYLGGTLATLPTNVFGRSLTVGDSVRIDVMPTRALPANRLDASAPSDVASFPWSLVFYLNNTWTSTFSHRLGSTRRRGLQGRANQRFRDWSWVPFGYEQPASPVVKDLPTVGYGGSFDTSGGTWTDAAGNRWTTSGYWDNASSPTNLTAMSADAEFLIDSGFWYGSMTFGLRQPAFDATFRRGNIAVLDKQSGTYLSAEGKVKNAAGVVLATLIPTASVKNNCNISIQYADTSSLAPSVRPGIDSNAFPRILVAYVDRTPVGTYTDAALMSWGTVRGLAGHIRNTGVDENGNPKPLTAAQTPNYVYNTSFYGFNWSPSPYFLALDPSAPTWNDVSQSNTATWETAARGRLNQPLRFKARIVQKGQSNDFWEVDTLSMFVDPIVWSFSNDGGKNFYPGYNIRNNPNGVLQFPEQPATNADPNFARKLVWKAISFSPESYIAGLVIRPWYGGLFSSITHQVGMFSGDPNVMPYDHYGSLKEDARFKVWSDPIPQSWWYASRTLNNTKDTQVFSPEILIIPERFVSDPEES